MSAEDKVVLITGASGALGQTVVPSFVATGARVIAADSGLDHADALGSSRPTAIHFPFKWKVAGT